MKLVFLGAGNMATNLASAFHAKGIGITCIYSRTEASAKALADRVGASYTTTLNEVPQDADVYFYALKDSVLRDVLMQIKAPAALHLHTAGSMGIEVFEGTGKPRCGVLYPFQTLSKDRILDFSSLPLFVETLQEEDFSVVEQLARTISSEVYPADSEVRRRLHLAGVFANNFANCMYAIGGEILAETGLPEHVLLSLIDETAAKVHSIPARQAQTGPAKRYDENVMQKHLELLPTEDLKEIYRLISKNIHEHS